MELYINPNGKDIVMWWQEKPGSPASKTFHVPQTSLAVRSCDVRNVLKELNDYLGTNHRMLEERDPSWERYVSIIHELKERGRTLYRVLFQYPAPSAPARELEAAIRKLVRGDELIVHCPDDAVTFPFGFICDPSQDDPDGMEEPPAIAHPGRADLDGCWINRFDITMLLNGGGCELSIGRETLRTVYALHEEATDKALERLSEDETECYRTLIALEMGKQTKWEPVRKACAKLAEFNGVVFVLAHTQGGDLHLAKTNARMDCIRFAEVLQHHMRADRSRLLILNCCASAIGGDGSSLLGAVAAKGFCGLIGTEAEILNVGALRCGSRLLWEMYFNGKSLGAAFRAMQDAPDLFPLNLFYTCYAQRGFQLDRPLERRSNHERQVLAGAGAP